MKNVSVFSFLILTIIVCSSFTNGNKNKWQKAYNQEGILIYTRTAERGLKEFKAITTVNQKMSTVLAVMKDYQNHPEWMKVMKECKLIKTDNSKTRYLYYAIKFPWPLTDRDLVSKSSFSLNKNGSVLMKMSAAPQSYSKNKEHIRIEFASGYWKIIPLKNGQTKIIYQYKSDPVGLPAFVVNMALLEVPKATFKGLKNQIQKPKYQKADLKWLY